MIYVYVKKNADNAWEVAGFITSLTNVRGLVTGNTYTNLKNTDNAILVADGIWQQDDIYQNNDEYLEYDYKEVVFDEDVGIVTNTYIYKRMDLNIIKADLSTRVTSHREMLMNSGFEHNGKLFGTDGDSRQWLTALVTYIRLNPALETIDVRIPSGEIVNMPVNDLDELFCDIIEYIKSLYTKEVSIIKNINDATDYAAARTAATWDDTPL